MSCPVCESTREVLTAKACLACVADFKQGGQLQLGQSEAYEQACRLRARGRFERYEENLPRYAEGVTNRPEPRIAHLRSFYWLENDFHKPVALFKDVNDFLDRKLECLAGMSLREMSVKHWPHCVAWMREVRLHKDELTSLVREHLRS